MTLLASNIREKKMSGQGMSLRRNQARVTKEARDRAQGREQGTERKVWETLPCPSVQ